MTTQPAITHTHTWDGSHNLPHWLHWDGAHPAIPGRDDHTQAQPGWMLVRWSDGQVTIASPQVAARAYGPDGLAGRLARAEARLAKARALHGETCPLAQGRVGTGFTCTMCDTLDTPKDRP